MPDPRPIDLLHLGRERVICCWQIDDSLVDPGPTSCVETLLEALDGWEPKRLLLTHIHLDHAGATGTLVERWPSVEVCVHERGAPHLVDPSKLLASAQRLYGEDMDRLWGDFEAVPAERLRVLHGGESLDGGIEVAYTPGHASHHVSYRWEDWAFVGDVGGVRIPPTDFTLPPTPPPDIDIEKWHESLELLAGWRPETLGLTHFGAGFAPESQLSEVARRLDSWAALVQDQDEREWIASVEEEISRATGGDLDTSAAYTQAAPPEQLYAGLRRYWDKRS